MSQLTANLDHKIDAQERLLRQFQGKPNILALLDIVGDEIQLIDDSLMDVLRITDINTVTGVQLDTLGRLIGQARGLLSDDDYRTLLRAQIFINHSDGTERFIINAAKLLLATSTVVAQEPSPAHISLIVDNLDYSSPEATNQTNRFLALIRKAVGLGITLDYLQADDLDTLFTLDFSTLADVDDLTGDTLADIINV